MVLPSGRDQRPAEAGAPLLRVRDLCLAYAGRGVVVFDRWSADFPAGLSFVTGDESSGKSSLLRLLAGDLRADSGHILLEPDQLQPHDASYRSQVWRADALSEALDGVTPLQWFASLRADRVGLVPRRLAALATGMALDEHLHKPMARLSAGSRRKVALAAAFAVHARVLLLDQPFAALDRPSIRFVVDLLAAAAGRASQVLVVADYELPPGLVPLQTITLDGR